MSPYSPLSLCTVNGCGELVQHGKCAKHQTEVRRESSARHRPYDGRWRDFSKRYLAKHPLCESERCSAIPAWKRPTATDLDHIDGQGPSGPRGYDPTNLRPLCHSCHSSKTARYDGGFGRPRRTPEDTP